MWEMSKKFRVAVFTAVVVFLVSACTRGGAAPPAVPTIPVQPQSEAQQEPIVVPPGPANQEEQRPFFPERKLEGPSGALFAVAEDRRTYGLYLAGNTISNRVLTVGVESINSYRVLALGAPSGSNLAFLPDFNFRFASRAVIATGTGETVQTLQGYFTSMAWTADSQHLGLVRLDDVDTSTPPGTSLLLIDLAGNQRAIRSQLPIARVLGFSKDGTIAYVTREVRERQTSSEAFAHMSLETGLVTDKLIGDSSKQVVYSGFQLVWTDAEEPIIAYVADSTNGEGGAALFLSRADGAPMRALTDLGTVPLSYAWSTDFGCVAFMGPSGAVHENRYGIWLADGFGKQRLLLTDGPDWDWQVSEVTSAGTVWMFNSLLGYVRLQRGAENLLPTVPEL